MKIDKRIKLRNKIYYVIVDVEYKINEYGMMRLCMKNYKDEYYDDGDFSLLIEKIEKKYDYEIAKKYDENISFMADVIYIYVRIPFLSGIKDFYISDNDHLPGSISWISKYEIDKYIKENNVKINFNNDFKLCDERTWRI